jgi:hypothetical protein
VKPTEQVYEGQIVGEHCRDKDNEVNVCRLKKLTKYRAASADKTVVLKGLPRENTLEMALEYIEDDELVEVHAGCDPFAQAAAQEEHDRKRAPCGRSKRRQSRARPSAEGPSSGTGVQKRSTRCKGRETLLAGTITGETPVPQVSNHSAFALTVAVG